MKKKLAVVLAGVAAFSLCFALVGCGGNTTSGDDGTTAMPEPAANLAPTEVDPGRVSTGDNTSDIWWLDGAVGTEGIYITHAGNDVGRSITWVDAEGNDVDSVFDCALTDDNHFVNAEGVTPEFDVVFYDNMMCYDYVTGNWYIRGNVDELMPLVAGKTFAREDGRWSVTFNEDGTIEDTYNGETITGTFEFLSPTVVELVYDGGSPDPETLYIVVEDDGTVYLDTGWEYMTEVTG